MQLLKHIYRRTIEVDEESSNLLRMVDCLELSSQHKILDVGCGYGKYLKAFSGRGYTISGIDINPEIVKKNRESGLSCFVPSELTDDEEVYDLLLMSHVIEHFSPSELLKFIDDSLQKLKAGGHFIIITPLLSTYFYDDFDHIKPYHPVGLSMVFGDRSSQVQFYADHHIELRDIWFRKAPFRISFFPGLYIKKYSQFPKVINFLLACLFRVTFGLVGKVDGWIGVYQKM